MATKIGHKMQVAGVVKKSGEIFFFKICQ